MRRVSVSELKNRLSHYLRLVKKGESIEIVEHDTPIARVTSVAPAPDSDGHLARLLRAGIVSAPQSVLDVKAFLRKRPIPCTGDAVQAVIDGRGDR
jgi:prevent-host-death family protein